MFAVQREDPDMAAGRLEAVFRCRNADCGCEMTVTRVTRRSPGADERPPVCICGSSMDRIAPEPPALLI
jgi:hypothetical protein